jgi:hypothetical protein
LLDLVAADVAQDAAKFFPFKKPGGACGRVHAVRPQAEHLDDPADGSLPDEVARMDGAFDVQPLAVIDHVFAPCASDRLAGLGKLIERGEGGLVRKVVLPSLQDPATDRAALGRDGRGRDQLHGGIVENLVEAARLPGARVLGDECGDLPGVGIIDPFQLAAGFEQAIGLAEDMTMVQVRHGEWELAAPHHRVREALRRVIHSVGLLGVHGVFEESISRLR